ncbi:MAG: hypothetical protein AB7G28_14280 [Pirellulales bacterium]
MDTTALSSLPLRNWPRVILFSLSLALMFAGGQYAEAQTSGPWPPSLGGYYWRGNDGSGNGSAGDFSWEGPWIGGRWYAEGDEGCQSGCQPPTYYQLPPEDGDPLYFRESFVQAPGPHSVALAGLSLPHSAVEFALNAAFNGGALTVDWVDITNSDSSGIFPVSFNGTTLNANVIVASAVNETVSFNGATIESDWVSFNGGTVGSEQEGTIHVSSTFVNAAPADGLGTMELGAGGGAWKLKTTSSVLFADILYMGPEEGQLDLTLEGDGASFFGVETASIAPAPESIVNLKVHTNAPHFTPSSIVKLADEGTVNLTIDNGGTLNSAVTRVAVEATSHANISLDHGHWIAKELMIGLEGQAMVTADNTSSIQSENTIVGRSFTSEPAKVTLDHTSTWEVNGNLTLGLEGEAVVEVKNNSTLHVAQEFVAAETSNTAGTVTLRDGGKLKLDHGGVLAKNGGFGTIDMFGAESKIELGEEATLVIGNKGVGRLNLQQGAKFESTTEVKLGVEEHSRGEVTISGANSQWEVGGDLSVGHGDGTHTANGLVVVEGGGELKVDEWAAIYVGRLDKSEGTLSLRGAESKLTGTTDLAQPLHIGSAGKGTVNVESGFKLDLSGKKMTLGEATTGNGTVMLTGSGSEVTLNELTIGESGRGLFEVASETKLHVTGESILLGAQANSNGTLRLQGNNSQLEFGGSFGLGERGKGTLELLEGAHLSTAALKLGAFASGEGRLTLAGSSDAGSPHSTFEATGELVVGDEGRGVLSIRQGSRLTSRGRATLAKQSSSHAEVDLEDNLSNWELQQDLIVGSAGDATVNIRQGQTIVKGDMILGELANSSGTVTVESSGPDRGLKIEKQLIVGKAGQATLNVLDGGVVNLTQFLSFDGILTLGQAQSSQGTVRVDGNASQLNVNQLIVAERGTGSMTVSDRANVTALGDLVLAKESNSNANMTVSGEGTQLTVTSAARVGPLGTASLTITDHAHATITQNLEIGSMSGSSSGSSQVSILEQASVTLNANVLVGPNAALHVANSEIEVSDLRLQGTAGVPAIFNLTSDAKLQAGNALFDRAVATIDQSSTLECFNLLRVAGAGSSSSILNVSGNGTAITQLSALQLGVSGRGAMNLSEGASVTFHAGTGEFQVGTSGQLTLGESATVELVGGWFNVQGTADLSGSQSYIRANTISISGTMRIRGGSNGIRAATITIASGGRLYAASAADQVHGRIVGKVINQGTLIVGQSPGVLVIEGDYEQDAGATLQLEIGGLTPATQFDQLVVTGAATIGGALDLAIINSGSGFQLPSVGDQFTLLQADGGITGGFTNAAALRSVAGGSLVQWSLSPVAGSLVLAATSITPLPVGDYSGNGIVDTADYAVWRDTAGGINLAADGNHDGAVNDLDYQLWKANFGHVLGSGSFENAAVPEPTTAVMACLSTIAVLAAARKQR